MSSFFLSLSRWDWLSTTGVFLVLLGVVFGFVVKRRKYRNPENPNELMPFEFEKKKWKSKKKRLEDFWEYVLIIGLGLELAVLPHSIKEVEELKRNNLELQNTTTGLKADLTFVDSELTPRIFKNEDSYLEKYQTRNPNLAVGAIVFSDSADESKGLAWQIRMRLIQLGWTVSWATITNGELRLKDGSTQMTKVSPGVTIDFFPGSEWPISQKSISCNEAAFDLLHALTNSGIQAIWYSPPAISRGKIVVMVGERPNRLDSEWLKSISQLYEGIARTSLENWKKEAVNK